MSLFKNKFFIVFFVLVVAVGLDQWTKQLAIEHLKMAPTQYFFGGFFQLLYAENPGAFLGMGGGWSRSVRFVIFGVIVVIGLCAILWSVLKNKLNLNEVWAYSFILAGGVGNVIDRLTHENGHVTDFMFIDLKFSEFARTGVFNIADIAIVIGVLIAFWPSVRSLFKPRA